MIDRKALRANFESPGVGKWKTFVLEAHDGGDAPAFLADVFGAEHVLETADAFMHQIVVDSDAPMTVDHLDARFWSFHGGGSARGMSRVLRMAVNNRRDLDYVWLPSEHLSKVHRGEEPVFARSDFRGSEVIGPESLQELSLVVRGRGAQGVLRDLQKDSARHALSVSRLGGSVHDGTEMVEEFVDLRALFVAAGSSFALHQEIVAEVVGRYRRLVEAAEAVALGFTPLEHEADEDGAFRMEGGPIELTFSRPVPSVLRLVRSLLSAREPFRLWGSPEFRDDRYAVVDAVDLHVASQLRLEIAPQMVRVHLRRGGCGNSVARLITNLQHRVDGEIRALDPRIQDALDDRVTQLTG